MMYERKENGGLEMKKLVLTDGRYEYDGKTRNVSVTDDELRKAGYVKLADDEEVVKRIELTEEEFEFMENNEYLELCHPGNIDFQDKVMSYANRHARNCEEKCKIATRLNQAYFNGYILQEEPRYYIKFNFSNNGFEYLNIRKDNDHWSVGAPFETSDIQTMFTQKEIEALQENKQAKGLDLNALKVNILDIDITANR
ncbi:hypothetical protein AB9M75_08110 [Lactobacillus sp. AN1001]